MVGVRVLVVILVLGAATPRPSGASSGFAGAQPPRPALLPGRSQWRRPSWRLAARAAKRKEGLQLHDICIVHFQLPGLAYEDGERLS